MNYDKIGEKIRQIREQELKQTREEFAEEIGISLQTAVRLESTNSKVNNIEIYVRISQITGYTIEELLLLKDDTRAKERIRRKINYILNVLSEDELEYIYTDINNFVKFTHRFDIKSLEEIKKDIKNKRDFAN